MFSLWPGSSVFLVPIFAAGPPRVSGNSSFPGSPWGSVYCAGLAYCGLWVGVWLGCSVGIPHVGAFRSDHIWREALASRRSQSRAPRVRVALVEETVSLFTETAVFYWAVRGSSVQGRGGHLTSSCFQHLLPGLFRAVDAPSCMSPVVCDAGIASPEALWWCRDRQEGILWALLTVGSGLTFFGLLSQLPLYFRFPAPSISPVCFLVYYVFFSWSLVLVRCEVNLEAMLSLDFIQKPQA